MQIVIDIPEYIYEHAKENSEDSNDEWAVMRAVEHGIPLPKGHGRLIDFDWIENECDFYYTDDDGSGCFKWRDIEKAPTIIEADK